MPANQKDAHWPLGGISRRMGFQNNPTDGYTCVDMLNCRNEDVFEHRLRGGSRPGLAQIIPPRASDVIPTVTTQLIQISPTKDTFLRSSTPATNYEGDNIKIGVGNNVDLVVDRGIMHFDLTNMLANATITIASIAFTNRQPAISPIGGAGKVRRLNQTGWVEAQATWNVYSTGNSWSPVNAASPQTGPYTTPPADVDWTIPTLDGAYLLTGLAAMAQDAYTNRGKQLHIILMADDETVDHNGAIFRSQNYSIQNQRPVLTITYTVPM